MNQLECTRADRVAPTHRSTTASDCTRVRRRRATPAATLTSHRAQGWTADESKFMAGLPGALPPMGNFDPAGFTEGKSVAELKMLREAEVTHGRVSMLASLGFLVQESFHPLFRLGDKDIGPAIRHLDEVRAEVPIFFEILVLGIGFAEISRSLAGWTAPAGANPADGPLANLPEDTPFRRLEDKYYPGDIGFDPLAIADTPSALVWYREAEVKHARLAMLAAVEAGAQAVLMAPTEILARQHLATITPLAKAAGLQIAILTGRERGKNRTSALDALVKGRAQIAVGTHALFQDEVKYKNLALAVIDEQHRFGVHQRLALAAKGNAVDTLVMTATPIPRTLMLTAYGDMDTSRLKEKPAGRKPVDTRVLPLERLEQIVDACGRALDAGDKVFWVCPLIEESETLDVAAAEDRQAVLTSRFGDQVGLVHGRMKGAEKDKIMAAFVDGNVNILVATTVIEVGVDVPAATVMVIEHAERFGLAQLHQLRGRIGRGNKLATCLLMYGSPLTETARSRLSIMRETDDGFLIAEKDLELRGAGELLGTRQSGMPELRLADLQTHADLLAAARDDAALLLNKDPDLTSERGQAVRTLLYLFERDAAVRNLRSG